MSTPLNISFPHNLYIHCLNAEKLSLDFLYPGLNPATVDSQMTSKSDFVQLLLPHLSAVTDILLIDVPAPLANILQQLGYKIRLIYQTTAQLYLEKLSLVPTISPERAKITDLTGNYSQIIYWQDTAHVDGLNVFNAAYDLLNQNGNLIIIGNFSLQRDPKSQRDEYAQFDYLTAQAGRCGFSEIQYSDYSEKMRAFLDFWLNLLQKYHQELLTHFQLEHQQLSHLRYRLQNLQYRYHIGAQTFSVIAWKKTNAPRWKITPMHSSQQSEICELFQHVFGKPMTPEFWQWKYGEGRGIGITAWAKQQLVAHYGGSVREILFFGQPRTAVQITDVMVSSKERGVLTRKGAFFLTTASFLEYFIGYGARTSIGFGFPSRRHVQLAENLNLYTPVGEVIELRYPSNLQSVTETPELIPWKEKLSFYTLLRLWRTQAWDKAKLIDKLWSEMANCLQDALVGLRDWQRVHYRYVLHPHHQYELFFVTQAQQVVAFVALHFEGENCKLMDFIGHLDHIPTTVQQVRVLAQQRGMAYVSLWITTNFVSLFPIRDRAQLTLEIAVPHNIWTQTFPPAQVAEHWWLMAGDTDYL